MKKLSKKILQAVSVSFALVALCPAAAEASAAKADQGIKMRLVNFKTCVEKSKLGKQEQASFEALKKQMETMLGEKEKTLNEMADKLNDPDYLDSLSPEAETELKRKFRTLSQEASQQQSQYYQAIQQANYKILDKLADVITQASETVAKKYGYHMVMNEEGAYYYDKELDISDDIVSVMDELFDKEAKEPKTSTGSNP